MPLSNTHFQYVFLVPFVGMPLGPSHLMCAPNAIPFLTRGFLNSVLLTLIFFSLPFWKTARKTTKKIRISSACRTPKIFGKEGKNAQNRKEFLEKEKGKENPKGKEKKIREYRSSKWHYRQIILLSNADEKDFGMQAQLFFAAWSGNHSRSKLFRSLDGRNARFKNGHARVETRVLKTLVCRKKCRMLLY